MDKQADVHLSVNEKRQSLINARTPINYTHAPHMIPIPIADHPMASHKCETNRSG